VVRGLVWAVAVSGEDGEPVKLMVMEGRAEGGVAFRGVGAGANTVGSKDGGGGRAASLYKETDEGD
jgi:hypothetical protein